MSVSRFSFPFFQAFASSTGNVGAGWKLYFWKTGTTDEAQTTYSDSALTTANANPVVADANGRWSDIFLQDALYAVELTDENDVQIAFADPVGSDLVTTIVGKEVERVTVATTGQTVLTLTGMTYTPGSNMMLVFRNGAHVDVGTDIQETTSTTFTWISGIQLQAGDQFTFIKNQTVSSSAPLASNVSYTPSGTGAVATDVQTQLREQGVYVTRFGADKSGTTDSTAAINAAISYAKATSFGEITVIWPAGTYLVNSIDLTGTDRITFLALGTVNITGNTTSSFLIGSTNYDAGTGTAPTITRNFKMKGGDWLLGPGAGTYDYALRLEHFVSGQFENVSVSGGFGPASGADKIAVYMQFSYYNTFTNCNFATPGAPSVTYKSYNLFMDTNNVNLNNFRDCIFSLGGAIPNGTTDTVGIKLAGNANTLLSCDTPTCDVGVIVTGRGNTLVGHYTEATNTSVKLESNAKGTTIVGGRFEVPQDGVAFDLSSSQNTSITSPYVNGVSGDTNRTFIAQGSACYGLQVSSPDLVDIDNEYTGTYRGTGGINEESVSQVKWLTFPATRQASTDANTLDHCNKATWTPTANNVTFSSASGWVIQHGNLVTVGFIVTWPATADSGNARIESLPVSVAASKSEMNGLALGYNGGGVVGGGVAASGTVIALKKASDGTNPTNADLSGATVSGTFTYGID